MDFLAQDAGVRSFLLVGICSGAKISYPGRALKDARVAGGVLVDPGDFGQQATTSPAAGDSAFVQHYVKHYWRNVFAKRLSWKRVAGWFTGEGELRLRAKGASRHSCAASSGGREEARATKTGLQIRSSRRSPRAACALLLAYGDAGASRRLLRHDAEARASSAARSPDRSRCACCPTRTTRSSRSRARRRCCAPSTSGSRRSRGTRVGAAPPARGRAAAAVTAGDPSGSGG